MLMVRIFMRLNKYIYTYIAIIVYFKNRRNWVG